MGITGGFTGTGVYPTVTSIVALTPTLVRVTFSEPMQDTADLRDPAFYGIVEGMGADPRTVVNVSPGGGANPTYVDLTLDGPLTPGADNYTLMVVTYS